MTRPSIHRCIDCASPQPCPRWSHPNVNLTAPGVVLNCPGFRPKETKKEESK